MHIAFLNPQGNFDNADSYMTEHPDFGGQLVYVKELAAAMVAAGHRVDIVTRRIDDPEWPEFAAPIDSYDDAPDALRILRIDCGGPEFLPKESLWPYLPEFVTNLVDFYGDDLPDFTTAHYADGGYCCAQFQRVTGRRFTFTGHSLGAQKMEKLGMSTANAEAMEQRFKFSRRIAAERLSMERSFGIVTSTAQERREQYAHQLYRGAVDVEDEKFSVIPPGVNTRVFTTEPAAEDAAVKARLEASLNRPDRPVLLISSRIDEKKNIAGAVKAWVGSDRLRARAGLVICVRGIEDPFAEIDGMAVDEQKVLRPILEMIEGAGLRDDVVFLNIGSQAELAATYRFFARRGSVFVLTSFYEPFGLAPIEAVACGLSCVATRNGGPTEIFSDGSAVLVDPEDVGDMERGLARALDQHEELARRARARVLDMYTWDRTAKRYLEVVADGVEQPFEVGQEIPELDASELIGVWLRA